MSDLAIERVEWPKRAEPASVVADYIARAGLAPEDTVGIMPSGENARELLFVHRPRPGGGQAGGASIFVHGLQWPGTWRLDGWRPAQSAFATYASDLGLRPEDVYGWFPERWDDQGDTTSWSGWYLAYRDRPEYAAGRERFALREGPYALGDSGSFPGAPDAPAAPSRAGEIRVDESRWPRRRMVLKLKGERMVEYLAEHLAASGLRPEDSFGIGPNKVNEKLWLVSLA